jgi:hypothetical protein
MAMLESHVQLTRRLESIGALGAHGLDQQRDAINSDQRRVLSVLRLERLQNSNFDNVA